MERVKNKKCPFVFIQIVFLQTYELGPNIDRNPAECQDKERTENFYIVRTCFAFHLSFTRDNEKEGILVFLDIVFHFLNRFHVHLSCEAAFVCTFEYIMILVFRILRFLVLYRWWLSVRICGPFYFLPFVVVLVFGRHFQIL